MKLYAVILYNNDRERLDLPIEVTDKSSNSFSLANKTAAKYAEENKLKKYRILGLY